MFDFEISLGALCLSNFFTTLIGSIRKVLFCFMLILLLIVLYFCCSILQQSLLILKTCDLILGGKMVNLKITKMIMLPIVLTAVLLTLTTIGALSDSQNVDLNGTIATVNVDLYSDASCTQPCTTINVGTLNPGSTFTQTVYVKNNGSIPVTLSMNANNWNPTTASNYLTLSWNRQNQILNAGTSCEATLTLTVAINADSLTSFGFSATITGTQ